MTPSGCATRPAHHGWWALIITALCLLIAACGNAGASVHVPPPQGWTDITPPDSGQAANYAVSPDIPGLILATISGRTQVSANPLTAARLWRSEDGGISWQSLDSLSVDSGALLYMPPGGHGLVFAYNLSDANMWVSADAGATWRKLPYVSTPYGAMTAEWNWLTGSVAIGKRLYAGGFEPGFGGTGAGGNQFSVSDDHGFTWRPVEVGANPAGANSVTQAIAPLDATGSAWLRLTTSGNRPTTHTAVERSIDGGATWSVVSHSVPVAGDFLWGAQFATNTAHPGHICATLTMDDYAKITTPATPTPFATAAPTRSSSASVSMPPPEPKDVALLASDDGGVTWRGGVVMAIRRAYGGAVAGVTMSADGSCYLATGQSHSVITAFANPSATFWRLVPGAAQPMALWTMVDRSVESLALAPRGPGLSERVIALTRFSGPGDGEKISCGGGCYTFQDGGVYRLIWQPLLTA